MTLHSPDLSKLGKSALIGGIALVVVLLLKWVFPAFDWASTETALLTVTAAWLVNTVKESLGL